VIALVRAAHLRVFHQAVYDVLRALTDAGLVRRIQPAVDCTVGHTPCLTASDDHGFVVDEAEVVYSGTCPDCAAKRTSS
jgi:Fur family transcriptional regulator, stress-responsive regulator